MTNAGLLAKVSGIEAKTSTDDSDQLYVGGQSYDIHSYFLYPEEFILVRKTVSGQFRDSGGVLPFGLDEYLMGIGGRSLPFGSTLLRIDTQRLILRSLRSVNYQANSWTWATPNKCFNFHETREFSAASFPTLSPPKVHINLTKQLAPCATARMNNSIAGYGNAEVL